MFWWIALAILVGLAILPLGVSARYNADGPYLAVIAGPIRIRLFPQKERKQKPKKEKKAKKTPASKHVEAPVLEPAAAPQPPKPAQPQTLEEKYPNLDKKPEVHKTIPKPAPEEGGSWKDFLSLVPIVLDFLGDFRRKLRVNRLEMRLILAGGDPCDLAVNYGRAWIALGNLMPQLERVLVIKKRDVEVECDFMASQTLVTARVDLTITLGRFLTATCKFAFRALKEYLNIMKKRKGGACK